MAPSPEDAAFGGGAPHVSSVGEYQESSHASRLGGLLTRSGVLGGALTAHG
jgi:hypothetical protein